MNTLIMYSATLFTEMGFANPFKTNLVFNALMDVGVYFCFRMANGLGNDSMDLSFGIVHHGRTRSSYVIRCIFPVRSQRSAHVRRSALDAFPRCAWNVHVFWSFQY